MAHLHPLSTLRISSGASPVFSSEYRASAGAPTCTTPRSTSLGSTLRRGPGSAAPAVPPPSTPRASATPSAAARALPPAPGLLVLLEPTRLDRGLAGTRPSYAPAPRPT